MKEKILKEFLNSFDNYKDASLIESINNGYKCIFEGYADVRDVEQEDAVTMFNRHAAYNTQFGSNPELDLITTTVHFEPTDGMETYGNESYEDYTEAQASNDDYDDGFGLTTKDLKDLV